MGAARASSPWARWVPVLFVLLGSRALAQPVSPADEILARPVSAGTTALLIEHLNVPAVQVRLGQALRDSSAAVRAAAARVLFAAGAKGFAAQMALAFAAETTEDAAVEQARFLIYFGPPESRATVQAAWPRLGAGMARSSASALAAVEGTAALDRIPALLSAGVRTPALHRFIRVAARGERAPIERLLADALRIGDTELAEAALRAASYDPKVVIGTDALNAVLATDRPASLRLAAAWYVTRVWDGAQSMSPAGVSAATAVFAERLAAAQQAKQPTHAFLFGRELLARASDSRSRRPDSWNEVLQSGDSTVQDLVRGSLALRVLSANEIDRVVRRSGFAARAKQSLGSGANQPRAELQLLDGYPKGLVASVFEAAGCRPAAETGAVSDGVAGGVVALRDDGRVATLSLMQARLAQPGCQLAVRVLLLLFVDTLRAPIRQGAERALLVPFQASFFECQDAPEPELPVIADAASKVVQPRKTRNVPPRYPRSAINDRVHGSVVIDATITSRGCISTAEVIHGVDPRLDWAGLESVLQWRYEPARLDGTPVPVIMTMTTLFSLN
jgi:TonB family protein